MIEVTQKQQVSEDSHYERWLKELESCEVFRQYSLFFQRSGSAYCIQQEVVAEFMVRIGNMIIQNSHLVRVGHELLRAADPENSVTEFHARNFSIARKSFLSGDRKYTCDDKFLVLQVLCSVACANYGLDWCSGRYVKNNKPLRDRVELITGVRIRQLD